ncbi:MAG: efflux RND transporter periplasmic adaptor subunit [Erythrobacter sp.]|uniref:efflux RND transporter periplasmic adaptor subunit n=1 Tax=Erythrobacter sp. TaxID=1042 RepID=UPI0026115FBD|nr:efflux RND transporter periplasmic adaptor subunit [Erythrobacter sp.]MDJ0978381.1 efflux RND transporter periplasmic adaptor subunit [Erythrobacter sp.]
MNYETTITAEAAEPLEAEARGAARGAMETSSTVKKLLIVGAIIFALLIAAALYFAVAGGEPVGAADDASQAPVVTVVVPGQTTVSGTIEVPGQIAARRAMPVGVEGEGGRVISVPVDAGQWVRKGQVLAVIDRSVQVQQAAAQAAQIEVSKADAALAQANLDRALQLVEKGFVSGADVDRLTAERDSARARVKVAEAQLAELRARNARLNVVAPATGYVLSRNVEPGQSVSAGSPALFTIARGGEMEMLAQVSEEQMVQLAQGVKAEVRLTGSDKVYSGQVWQLSPTVDQNTRQGTARVALAFSPELRPGGFATARIDGGDITATLLPESAVLADDEGAFVYVVDEDNKATRRAVTIGRATEQGIAISEGLSGREMVVASAGGFLNPGETVNPRRAET